MRLASRPTGFSVGCTILELLIFGKVTRSFGRLPEMCIRDSGEIVPDIVVRLALCVTAAARVGSQRLAEECLGDLVIAVTIQPFIEVGAGGLLRGYEVDARAIRDLSLIHI